MRPTGRTIVLFNSLFPNLCWLLHSCFAATWDDLGSFWDSDDSARPLAFPFCGARLQCFIFAICGIFVIGSNSCGLRFFFVCSNFQLHLFFMCLCVLEFATFTCFWSAFWRLLCVHTSFEMFKTERKTWQLELKQKDCSTMHWLRGAGYNGLQHFSDFYLKHIENHVFLLSESNKDTLMSGYNAEKV